MENVRNEFKNRVDEINRYFDFLNHIKEQKVKIQENDGSKNIESLLPPTLRASAILLLYNLLESTIIQAIDYIHITISSHTNLTYDEAIDEIKKIWIEYKYDNFKGTDKGSEQIFNALQTISNEKINIFDANTEKMDYLRKVKGVNFSGKIDALQVKKFAHKYGFNLNRRVLGRNLSQIKSQRNALAHGELSFNECGNNYDFSKLLKLKKESILFLREFLDNVEIFIKQEKYKI